MTSSRVLHSYSFMSTHFATVYPMRVWAQRLAYFTFTLLGAGFKTPGVPKRGSRWPTHEYQKTVETTYGLLPRPPQTPVARFKRRDATLGLVHTRSVCRTRHFR